MTTTAFALVALAASAGAGPDGEAFFENEVRPLLASACVRCHGPKKAEGGLRLDGPTAVSRGGDSGPAVVPGKPEASLLVKAVRHRDEPKMPPDKPLAPKQVEVLVRWVRDGAAWPEAAPAATGGLRSGPVTARDREFWSFRPVTAPPVPAARDAAWPLTPVDHFLLARLEAEGLRPAPDADRRTWLRRVGFDLTGLPPTPQEIDAFVNDMRPDAFERVADRLLASPAYGERWGRHWLDVVRYADTAGDGADYPTPEAYRYRNYVIDALNRDTPYDRFVREQIAGDAIARDEADRERYARLVTATGYLAVGKRFGYAPNKAYQHLDLADAIDNLGQTFLGLTLGCARCHDHKYDPVTASDYYGLYGILASTEITFPGGEEHKKPAGLVSLLPRVEAQARERHRAAAVAAAEAEVKRLTAEKADKVKLAEAEKNLKAAREAGPDGPLAYAVREGTPADARLQKRGEPERPGDVVPRHFPEILGGDRLARPGAGSGRLELAGWVTRPSNPLTARVMVNRVWLGHFGDGLVRTPNDFGSRGDKPSHPELLDWLASRFVADGWSLKKLHRLIVLSRAYRQAATGDADTVSRDPDNRLLGRFARRPLSAEELRDAMLAASGRLDRSPGGPHPFPPVASWGFTIHKPFVGGYDSDRRSVYLMVQRSRRHPYLALFDGADPNQSTPARRQTTTPAQSLFLLNAPFVHDQAAGLARRVLALPDVNRRLDAAFALTVGRPPTPDELRDTVEFLARVRGPAGGDEAAWAALGRVLLTGNEFLFVD
jgi:mono/diheme cytochrome c family protein